QVSRITRRATLEQRKKRGSVRNGGKWNALFHESPPGRKRASHLGARVKSCPTGTGFGRRDGLPASAPARKLTYTGVSNPVLAPLAALPRWRPLPPRRAACQVQSGQYGEFG